MSLSWIQATAGAPTARWTPAQIHDSVAAIARQAAYAIPVKQSIIGRLMSTAIRWIVDLLQRTGSWPNLRYVLITLVGLLVLFVAAGVLLDMRTKARRATGLEFRTLGGEARDFWLLAEQLTAAGKHVEACHALYTAVLDSLARAGLLQLHTSRTSGDYARALRARHAPQATGFARFAKQFERDVYGWSVPTHDDYVRLAAAAAVLAPRGAAA